MFNDTLNSTASSSGCLVSNQEIWFNTIFLTTISFLTFVGNAIALHAFIVTPALKKITYYFIASLCISDLMIALVSIPLWVSHTFTCWAPIEYIDNVYLALDIFCGTWSIMSLAMIGIERFICIKYALHYYRLITTKRAYYLIVFVLTYSGIVLAIEIGTDIKRDNDANTYDDLEDRQKKPSIMILQLLIVFFSYFLPVIIKIVSYTKIYNEASRQSAQIRKLERTFNNNFENYDKTETENETEITEAEEVVEKRKCTKTTSDASSRVSWTVSPLSRKRQCTVERIKVLNDLNEEESDDSDDTEDSGKTSSVIKLQGLFSKLSFLKNQHGSSKLTNRNGSNRSNRSNTSHDMVKNGKTSVEMPNGKYTNLNHDNVKRSLPLINNNKEMNGNHGDLSSSSDDEAELKKVSSLQYQPTILFCPEDKRKRSVSCPHYTTIHETRKSLEPNDAYNVKETSKKFDKSRRFTPTSSPLFQRLRAASRWSPANSPLLFRRSTRNKNENKRREQKIKRFKKELRAAKVVALIMGTFLFCWTPFMMMVMLDSFNVTIQVRWVMIAKDLHYLNSTLNPILYVLLNRVYRQAVMKVLTKFKIYMRK